MSDYRRWYQPGGTYFFTIVTRNRRQLFRSALARSLLREALAEVRRELPFQMIATVLLWDHFHTIWSLPSGDDDFSTRWRRIKSHFTSRWRELGGRGAIISPSQSQRGHRGVWQRRFWEHLIRDEEDLERHCDYLHYNPIKHGYVTRLADWKYSTFHGFVTAGQYEADWGASVPISVRDMELE